MQNPNAVLAIQPGVRFREMQAEALAEPPYKVFKGFSGDFNKHPTKLHEVVRMKKHNARLYPNALRWHTHKAEQLGWRTNSAGSWPDDIDEWEDDLEELVADGTVENERDGLAYLYQNDKDFQDQMDESWASMGKSDTQENVHHLWSVAHRHVTKYIWMRRIAGKHWNK